MNKQQPQQKEKAMKPDDSAGINMSGHVLIKDKQTGEVLLNKRNAIHYGNMAALVAAAITQSRSLTSDSTAYVHRLAFGNGATAVDASGRVVYRTPRVSESYNESASLYNRTYFKDISEDSDSNDPNRIEVIPGNSYTDLRITCPLGFNEPAGQDLFDTSTDNQGDFVFDEIALYSFANDISDAVMLTHVVFHPVQKSANRSIEIVYTLRIQLN